MKDELGWGDTLPGVKYPRGQDCLRYLVPKDKISQGGTFYPGVKIPWGQDKPVHRHENTAQLALVLFYWSMDWTG